MRLTKTLLFVVVVLAGCVGLQAQDLHNSLFYMNPLHMNPAFTGAFEGTFRLGGIYRDQARSAIGSSAYSTPAIYGDAPIIMVGKRSWLGGGILVLQDVAGDGDLKTAGGNLSAALHLAMDKKSKNVFTIGLQYGRYTRSFDANNYCDEGTIIEEDYDPCSSISTNAMVDNVFGGNTGPNPGPGGSNNNNPETSYTDINAGILLKSKINKKTDFNIGFSARHITTPGSDFNFTASPEDLNLRFIAHAQLSNQMTDKWSITPELYFSNISPSNQIQLHGWAGYMLKSEKNIQLNFGLGYRVEDAGQVLLGMDYGDLKAALAYDVTLSELSDVNSSQGGFELALYYIFKIYKKPDVKPAILCPHL